MLGPIAVLGQVGEGHAVVGEHGVDLVGEDLDHVPEEGGAFHLAGAVVELDVGELRDPVDGQEHDELAVGVAQLAAVDVDVADLVGLEPLALSPWSPRPAAGRCRGAGGSGAGRCG